MLDTAATSEILTMLREAHGDATPRTAASRAAPTPPGPPSHAAPAATEDDGGGEPAEPATAATTTPSDRPAPPGAGVVTVRVLGSLAVLGADGRPVRGLRAKSLELMVYLAVHRRGASLDDIMEAIWGDATPRRAAERLSTCAGNLRGVIRAATQPDPRRHPNQHR